MSKKIVSNLFLCLFLVCGILEFRVLISGDLVSCKSMDLKSEETVFAFDFNKVIANRDSKSSFSIGLNAIARTKGALFLDLWNYFKIIKKSYPKYCVKEECFEAFFDKHPDLRSNYESIYLDAAACQIIDYEMIDLALKLNANGYTPTIFSNMGSKIYNHMKNSRLDIKCALSHFNALELVSSKEDNYLHKPQADFYTKYINEVKNIKPLVKNIIFVDDKKENVDAFANICKNCGINFYGFVFKDDQAKAKVLKDYLVQILKINI